MDLETGRSHSAQKQKKKKKAIRHNVPRSYQYLTSSCLLLLLLLLRLRLRLCLIILDPSACTPVVFLPCPASQAAILIFLFFLFLSFSLSLVLLFFFLPFYSISSIFPRHSCSSFSSYPRLHISHISLQIRSKQKVTVPSGHSVSPLRCSLFRTNQPTFSFYFFSLFNRAVAWSWLVA